MLRTKQRQTTTPSRDSLTLHEMRSGSGWVWWVLWETHQPQPAPSPYFHALDGITHNTNALETCPPDRARANYTEAIPSTDCGRGSTAYQRFTAWFWLIRAHPTAPVLTIPKLYLARTAVGALRHTNALRLGSSSTAVVVEFPEFDWASWGSGVS